MCVYMCVCVCVCVCVNTDRYGWDSSVQLIERRTRDRKVPSSIPGAAGEFSSPELTLVLTLIPCPFYPHVTTVKLAVARKRRRSFW